MRSVAAVFFALLLLSALCSNAQAMSVGAEVTIRSESSGGARRGSPAVAFGGNVFLAVWQEGWHGEGENSRIYAVRVGLDGQPVGSPVEIAPSSAGVQENPRVAFFNGIFLVVWQDLRNGNDSDVLAARVSAAGAVLNSPPISIATGSRTQVMPDVVADNEGFMVVWHGFQGGEMFPKIFAARVRTDGAVGQSVVVTDGAGPRIAWNGSEHLMVYSAVAQSGIITAAQAMKVVRLNVTGSATGSTLFIWGAPRYSLCTAPGSGGWVIVRHEGYPRPWGGTGIQRAINITTTGAFAPDGPTQGAFLEGNPPPVPANWLDTSYEKGGAWPYGVSAVVSDGNNCVAVWQRYQVGGAFGYAMNSGDIRAGRLDRWKPLDGDGIAVAASAANERNPALAGNGAGKLLCIYEKVLDGRMQIAARMLETP